MEDLVPRQQESYEKRERVGEAETARQEEECLTFSPE